MSHSTSHQTLDLHIGYPKTGTTSLQNVLVNNTDILLRKGSLYPTTGRIGNAHHGYVYSLTSDPRYQEECEFTTLLDKLKSEVAQAKTLRTIISSETLVFTKHLDRIAESFKSMFTEVNILIALRNPVDWIYSDYNQGVKAHRNITDTFNGFVTKISKFPKGPLNYAHQVDKWAKYFGEDSIQIVDFERHKTALLPRLLNLLNIEHSELREVNSKLKNDNKSVSLEELEAIRVINQGNPKFQDKMKQAKIFDRTGDLATRPFLDSNNMSLLHQQIETINNRFGTTWETTKLEQFSTKQFEI